MLRFAAHPVHAYSTGLPCSTNWFSLFPPENSLFRGVGNSKLKPHDISGLGGFDPVYSRPNPRNSLFFPCKTGKSGQRRVRSMELESQGYFAVRSLSSDPRWRNGSIYLFGLDTYGNTLFSGDPYSSQWWAALLPS